jgi:hypothetical protein
MGVCVEITVWYCSLVAAYTTKARRKEGKNEKERERERERDTHRTR